MPEGVENACQTKAGKIVVLGAGPAGLGAAYQLTRKGHSQVILLEARDRVGGNAGSFVLADIPVDYGSHRLHPACDSDILADLKHMLGDDLLDRPRHGRIRLKGRWIHFPLKPFDLLLHLSPQFTIGVGIDLIAKLIPRPGASVETFASILKRGLGRTICQEFYFPYARKLWGLAPEELSPTQARRRVSGSSLGKMIAKVLRAVPGLRRPGGGRFYYPREGYGQISARLAEMARKAGADVRLETRVTAVEHDNKKVTAVRTQHGGKEDLILTDTVWSTLPVTMLSSIMSPPAPAEVLTATANIRFRGMVLIYLVVEEDQFSEYDAHYFPEESIAISRLSEPKNYSERSQPHGRTVLCAELPCEVGSTQWEANEGELKAIVCHSLEVAGLPVPRDVSEVVIRRIPHAYPIYDADYEQSLAVVDAWLDGFEGLLTFGRQGLFVHDNTHHALFMAFAAVDCLASDHCFDRQRWREYRQIFETHVVED